MLCPVYILKLPFLGLKDKIVVGNKQTDWNWYFSVVEIAGSHTNQFQSVFFITFQLQNNFHTLEGLFESTDRTQLIL